MKAGKEALFELRKIILENVDLFKPQTDKHDFKVNIPHHLVSIEADEDKIDQVMESLISNAIKFSPQAEKIWAESELGKGSTFSFTLSITSANQKLVRKSS